MPGEALIEHVNAAALCTFIRLAHPVRSRRTRRNSGSAFRSACRQSATESGCVTAPRYRWWCLVALGRSERKYRLVGEQPGLRRASSKDLFWFLVKDILTVYV